MLPRLLLPLASMMLLSTGACSQRASTAKAKAPIDAPAQAVAPKAEPKDAKPATPVDRTAPFVFTVTDGLPAELVDELPLWESVTAPVGDRNTTAMRLYRDGRVFIYSAYCRKTVDGSQTSQPAPQQWRLEKTVSKVGVGEVEDHIRDRIKRGILLPPATAKRPADLPADLSTLTHRAWIDNGEHVIVMIADGNEKMSPVTRIEAAIHTHAVKDSYQLEQC